MSLDEMIYAVTSSAIENAGLTIDDIGGVCMAASDLNDGRAISTMTLTGSTGSFHKTEMRVCNESLAALWLGAAEVGSGAADALIVCSWSKFSDVPDPRAIPALAMEPAMTRALGYHPDAVLRLRESAETGTITVTGDRPLDPQDASVALIITRDDPAKPSAVNLIGTGASMGPYMRPGEPVLAPAATAAAAALRRGGKSASELTSVYVAGMHRITDDALAAAVGVPVSKIIRQTPAWGDLGYAAGLLSVGAALTAGVHGLVLVVSAGGLGYENAHSILLESE